MYCSIKKRWNRFLTVRVRVPEAAPKRRGDMPLAVVVTTHMPERQHSGIKSWAAPETPKSYVSVVEVGHTRWRTRGNDGLAGSGRTTPLHDPKVSPDMLSTAEGLLPVSSARSLFKGVSAVRALQ